MGISDSEQLLFPSEVKAYYQSAIIDLSTLSHINFRHFRFRLADGLFYKVNRKIRFSGDLKKQILEKLPLDIYYSSACWLNPHKLGSKKTGKILENIIISCDLVFDVDIDGEEIKSFEEARRQVISIKNFLVSRNFDIRYLAFSGSKGFHLVCNDPWYEEVRLENPTEREKKAAEKRKLLVAEAKAKGMFFDEKVTVDTRRIIRLPGTMNSKTGLICTILNEDQINLPLEKIFKLATPIEIITPRIPCSTGEMTKHFVLAKSLGAVGRLGVRPALENGRYFSTFITNNVPRSKLKIPVLEFGKWKSLNEVTRIIVDIQKRYGIGDVFLFDDMNKYVGFSLKAVSIRRLEKILFNSNSMNFNACKKFRCTYVRVGKSVALDNTIIRPAPILVKVIESELRGQVSRPHFEFLSSMGVKVRAPYNRLCGSSKEDLELIHGIME